MKNFIKVASKIFVKKTTVPALQYFLIDADNQKVVFTDLDNLVEAKIHIAGQGKILAPFANVSNYINKTKAKNISLAIVNGELQVNGIEFAQKDKIPTDEYPIPTLLAFPENGGMLGVNELDLVEKFQGTEPTQIILNGVYLAGKHIVATDRQVLREVETAKLSLQRPSVLPTLAVKTLRALSGNWQVASGPDAKLKFTQGNITVISKLIDGVYPDYKRILDNIEVLASFSLNKEDLTDFVGNSSWIKNEEERSGCPVFEVTAEGVFVGLYGTAILRKFFPSANVVGNTTTSFQGVYLEEALKALSTEITFSGKDMNGPWAISDRENSNLKTVIMPIANWMPGTAPKEEDELNFNPKEAAHG